VLLVDEDSNELLPRVAQEVEDEFARAFASRVAGERRILVDTDERGRSLIGAPLLAGARVLGVLHACTSRTGSFSREDAELLQLAAERGALGLQRALLNVELQRLNRLRERLSPDVWRRVSG
jgi:GAF domain-containing protein